MDVTGEGGEKAHVLHMGLIVQDALVQVRQAPAQRHVEIELLAENLGGGTGIGVAPGAERDQQTVCGIESHITVHHGADTDGGEGINLHIIMDADIFPEGGITGLQALPDGFQAVGPKAALELVLPLVAALGNGIMLLIHQDGLDAGTAEFDAQDGFSGFDNGTGIHTT